MKNFLVLNVVLLSVFLNAAENTQLAAKEAVARLEKALLVKSSCKTSFTKIYDGEEYKEYSGTTSCGETNGSLDEIGNQVMYLRNVIQAVEVAKKTDLGISQENLVTAVLDSVNEKLSSILVLYEKAQRQGNIAANQERIAAEKKVAQEIISQILNELKCRNEAGVIDINSIESTTDFKVIDCLGLQTYESILNFAHHYLADRVSRYQRSANNFDKLRMIRESMFYLNPYIQIVKNVEILLGRVDNKYIHSKFFNEAWQNQVIAAYQMVGIQLTLDFCKKIEDDSGREYYCTLPEDILLFIKNSKQDPARLAALKVKKITITGNEGGFKKTTHLSIEKTDGFYSVSGDYGALIRWPNEPISEIIEDKIRKTSIE